MHLLYYKGKNVFQKKCGVFGSHRRESINSLKKKYSHSMEPTQNDAAIEKTLNEVAKDGCQFLLDEVFLDLEVGGRGWQSRDHHAPEQ